VVTSNNPDIQVSVAQGQFWTITASHQAANGSDVTIDHETMTFQLFGDLTPQTVARIATLTNDGYFTGGFPGQSPPVAAGQYIPRITSVASSGFSIVQGGSSSATSTASSTGIPPIATEPVQQLAFTGQSQIAMANTGQPDSTDAQFFITTGVPSPSVQQAFDFTYTIFGQLVSGQQTLSDLSKVAVQTNFSGELSQPITPVTINAVSLSSSNVNGVIHIDTTSASPGDAANITVMVSDPKDGSQVIHSFKVTASAYDGPTEPAINFKPFAGPTTATTNENGPTSVQLVGQSGYPASSTPGTLSYTILTQPAHGTIGQFNAATGTLVYTPNPGYFGPDSFQFQTVAMGPVSSPATVISNPATVAIAVEYVPPPLVTVTGVGDVMNKRHLVTQIIVHFSGDVNTTQADETSIYRLALPGRHGSYTAKNAQILELKKAAYDASTRTVKIDLRTPHSLSKIKWQLQINGLPPQGLTDSLGRLIDGDHNGAPGGNAIAFLTKSGVVLS
jgi:cyclophilin family peptidyl-prolyl cis-trans isomerase